jgi:hypothetical protein
VPFIVCKSAIIALALQPPAGQLMGLFLFVFNIVGFGAGPDCRLLTDFVFKDERYDRLVAGERRDCGIGDRVPAMRLALGTLTEQCSRARRPA